MVLEVLKKVITKYNKIKVREICVGKWVKRFRRKKKQKQYIKNCYYKIKKNKTNNKCLIKPYSHPICFGQNDAKFSQICL